MIRNGLKAIQTSLVLCILTIACSTAARWYEQDRTGTGRDLRMIEAPRSYTSTPQWQNDRYNNRAWYTIQRAPRGYEALDEYSDEWCYGPDCQN